MAIPVLIIGKSGSGKSTSLRNCADSFDLIKVMDKPLPFKGKFSSGVSDNYEVIKKWLTGSKKPSVAIDDAGYLITNQFMRGHSNAGKGMVCSHFITTLVIVSGAWSTSLQPVFQPTRLFI